MGESRPVRRDLVCNNVMILKTQAIVLKMVPFSETSRIVTWLTADHGRLATIVKGSQRRKSPFLGQYDLFYTCELLFYLRRHQGIHIVKECSPLKPRVTLRSQWRATACASYFSHLVARISPPYAPHPELFRLLDTALDAFAESQNLEACLYWFELKVMAAMGLSPQLNECLKCKRSLNGSADRVRPDRPSGVPAPRRPVPVFSFARGGVLCGACAGSMEKEAERMAPDVLGILRFWQQSREWNSARSSRCTPRQLRDVERVLGRFLQYHLEVGAASRELALEVMRYRFRRAESIL